MKKTLLIYIVTLTLIPHFTSAKLVDRIVATVNGELITASDLNAFKVQLRRGQFADDLIIKDKKPLLKSQKKLLEALINQKLIDSEVKKQNLTISSEQVDAEIRSLTKRNSMTQRQFRRFLRKQGFRFSEYKKFIKQQLERRSLIERFISSKIKISDSDIASYYIEHYGSGKNETFEYRIAHILFLPKGGNVKAAKARATAVLEKLKSGKESFNDLAAQHSEDPTFSPGGLLGEFKSGESLSSIDKAISPMRINETSNIVRSRVGFHILKLLDKKLVSSPGFEKEKNQIRNLLYQQSLEQHFSLWLEQKKSDAFININKKSTNS